MYIYLSIYIYIYIYIYEYEYVYANVCIIKVSKVILKYVALLIDGLCLFSSGVATRTIPYVNQGHLPPYVQEISNLVES
jgi:hypothetical protein